ncbi:MAG: LysM peptidoglycan-binding domain-containing protein, partial [Pseudomonadota bacterium]
VNAIDRHNTEDFWEMSEYRYLKKETRNYIPKLIAAILIAKNPEKYGFHELEYEPPLVYDKVKVPDATDLKVIATASETDYQIIQELNPELRRGCTPPSYPGYEVKIPYGKKEIFEKNFAKIPHDQRFTFARHVIRGGETISGIARLYNTQVQPILQLNKIRNPRSVRAGTSLIIPVRSAKVVKRNIGNKVGLTEVPKKRYLHLEREEIIYTVKKGDTLWDIAQRHEVSTSEIRDWNNLSKNDLIYPGNMLKLRIKRDLSS